MPITLDDVRAAAAAIAGALPVTPAEASPRLSELAGTELFLKLENQHHTGSFKERGAVNKLKSLTPEQARAGVIAMSAGNHAQAVAWHATRLGIQATIVMPAQTPFTKVERTEAYGGRVALHGETLSDAGAHAQELAARDGLTFVHPYDDPWVMAGQGTAALEFLAAFPDLDMLVVPVGGGGLIAGMAVAAKAIKPSLRILGVEAAAYPSMKQALAGETVDCGGVTVAEGIAVKAPGILTREVIARLVDDILVVDEAALEAAVYHFVTVQKLVVEAAGAAPLAAVLADPARFKGRKVGLVVTGGNLDARLLAQILMRGLIRDGRIVRLRIGLTDVPGALAQICRLLGDAGGNIVEVYHQRLFHDVPVKMAEIDVILETRDRGHVGQILKTLAAAGCRAELMLDVS
ncbi:MAG: threonine ammonia-lyase [Azospirillum sp.]|nr:threonine ammonia-lyase [Azospirillum sp.]